MVHLLLPLLAQLFLLSFESARVPADWKVAKRTPLYKKVPMLDPNSYRMLAVNGTIYRLYANIIRSLLTTWCRSKSKILDTQFGLYPGRNTLQPMFILRHLQHAARTIKPSNSPRLHTAFIDFKQAYDTIPRQVLWSHFRRIRMPAILLSALQSLFASDQYLLQDGHKAARVKPTVGLKQGCPLSPLPFLLYINGIGTIAEGVQGAVTGTDDVRVMHMLYADDLTLQANAPDAMQTMLNRLVVYARTKHLTINTAESEVVNFNSRRGAQVPTFMLAGAALKCSDSFKYLGMTYHRILNMTASSEHAAIPMPSAAHRIRRFVWDIATYDKPYASL